MTFSLFGTDALLLLFKSLISISDCAWDMRKIPCRNFAPVPDRPFGHIDYDFVLVSVYHHGAPYIPASL